ncbi:MAG: NUDIX domain-containing protein [Candidatus Micrarchaeaceae archaeon]
MKKCLVAASIPIDMEKKKVLLIKHKKLEVWIYPGGHLEENEFPEECALRETKEEVGIGVELFGEDEVNYSDNVSKTRIKPFAIVEEDVPYKDGHHRHCDFIYLASVKSNEVSINEREATDVGWFGEEDIENLKTFENVKQILKAAFNSLSKS